MATSGTVTFSVTEEDIIRDALESIGALDPQNALQSAEVVTARRKLNMIVKQWTAQLDFAPGLKMWTRRRATMFLQQDQVAYSLGPSGDHATESYVQTTLSTDEATSSVSLGLAAFAGMSASDNIGIVLNDGSIHWTTISGTPGATTTITTGLASAASAGNAVFVYTTKMRRPFALDTCVRRDEDENDAPVDTLMTLQEYELLPAKTTRGSPSRLYFEAQRTNAKVFLDCAPEDCNHVLRFVYLSYVEDFSATTDDADFPAEWARPLAAQLGIDLCSLYQRPVTQTMRDLLNEALAMARKAYPENAVLEYQNCPDEY